MRRFVVGLGLLVLLSACGTPIDTSDDRVLPTRVTLIAATTAPPNALPVTESAPMTEANNILRFWEARQGNLSADTPERWQFDGVAGDAITVRVLGVDALLTLQAANGAILQSAEEIDLTLPADGTYQVIVQAAFESATIGAYEIGLGYSDRPNPFRESSTLVPEVVGVPTPSPVYGGLGAFINQLENNQTLGGTLTESGTPHVYTFAGQAGAYVLVEMRYVNGELDPRLTLFNPQGLPMATDADSGGDGIAQLLNVRLPEDGLYTIQAAGSAPGGYAVKLYQYADYVPVTPTLVTLPAPTLIPTFIIPTPAPAFPGVRLQDHLPVTESLTTPSDVDIYSLALNEGDVITLGANAINGSTMQLRMEVLNPDGLIVASAESATSNANGDVLIHPLRADLTGIYQVFVSPSNDAFGQYAISYGLGSSRLNVSMGTPLRDTQTQGVIRRRGSRDIWTLELKAGDIITVGANPADSSFDPLIDIVPADDADNVLGVDDNSGGVRAAYIQQVTIPTTGVYLVRIKAAQAASVGPYTLVWRYINVAPTPTYPAPTYPLLTLEDTVADSAYAFYPFYGRAGQEIRVEVTANTDGFDPVAALLAPDGTVWAEADDSDGTLNPSFVTTLPVDGTYNVRVNGYISGGDFSLRVQELFPPIIPPTMPPTAIIPTVTPSITPP